MKFYISTTGIKRVTISSSAVGGRDGDEDGGSELWGRMKGKGLPNSTRRIYNRTVFLPAIIMLGIILPFLFLRIAFLVLESATSCHSSFGCIRWRIFGGSDSSLLREELTRALMEADIDGIDDVGKMQGIEGTSIPASFKDLVKDVTTNRQDIRAFAIKTKAMLLSMEQKVQTARRHESIYWHLASHGVPNSLHCLCLKLAEEYAVNALARARLPPPEFVYRLTDPSFHHVALLTDNILAASVVISSTLESSVNPEKLVFHVVTDKKTYTPMHAWFAINSIKQGTVEIKGLHQYDWSHEVNVGIKEMLEIHRLIWRHKYKRLEDEPFTGDERNLESLCPSSISLLNYLRIYIPELFPDLEKIVFLDDDIVVQKDLSSLWDLDLNGKVVGAVVDSWCGYDCCPGRKYKDYFNFTDPVISFNLDYDRCGWLYGMNIFDLKAWRNSKITAIYHHWLKLSLYSGLGLWLPGALPPALIAFEDHVHHIDPSWHLAGLGHRFPQVNLQMLEGAAVIHYSGPAKPWLEISDSKLRSLWNRHVNLSNEFVRKCKILG